MDSMRELFPGNQGSCTEVQHNELTVTAARWPSQRLVFLEILGHFNGTNGTSLTVPRSEARFDLASAELLGEGGSNLVNRLL